MKTLIEIKDEVAQENGKPNWNELLYWGSSLNGFQFPEAINEVAKRYAAQFIQLAVDEVSVEIQCENTSIRRAKESIIKLNDRL